MRAYAVKEWLTHFPGFVDDLSDRLVTFSELLRTSIANVTADGAGLAVSLQAPYWDFLCVICTAYDPGEIRLLGG